MPRKATSLDEQLLLEACRFGGNDEAVAGMLRNFHFEESVLQQALVTIESSGQVDLATATAKTARRLRRRLESRKAE